MKIGLKSYNIFEHNKSIDIIIFYSKIFLSIKNKKDILKLTNQCFVEELEYKNGVFILRIGS